MENSNIILLELAGMSLIGAVFHLMLKLDSKSKTAKAAGQIFSGKDFLWDEKFAIGANMAAQIFILFWTPELVNNYPVLKGWVMGINGLAGFAGSYLLSVAFGKASKKIDKMVSDKTE